MFIIKMFKVYFNMIKNQRFNFSSDGYNTKSTYLYFMNIEAL